MKLADYLSLHANLSPSAMRRQLGVTHTAFRRFMTGERIPKPQTVQQISDLTGGAVQLRDFLDRQPPKCAVILKRADGKISVILPWNDREKDLDDCIAALRVEPQEFERYTPPLKTAMNELGLRVWPQANGMFLLDRKPVDARMVVEAANRIRRSRGQAVIRYPGVNGGAE